ncbi:hypothetical protein Trydic_g61 [Trypoxylus dichotomus]
MKADLVRGWAVFFSSVLELSLKFVEFHEDHTSTSVEVAFIELNWHGTYRGSVISLGIDIQAIYMTFYEYFNLERLWDHWIPHNFAKAETQGQVMLKRLG